MTRGLSIAVTAAHEGDLHRTADLHVSRLPHGLFPRLGRPFVRRWHRAHLGTTHGVLLVARDRDAVVGFLLGSTDQRANIASIVTRHRRELMLSGSTAMLTRPWLIASFIRTRARRYAHRMLRPRDDVHAPSPQAHAPAATAVLEAVVVDGPARGRGIGVALIDAYLDQVARAGIRQVQLVTKAGPEGAGAFYEHHGWQRSGSHIDRDGDEVLEYRIHPRAGRHR